MATELEFKRLRLIVATHLAIWILALGVAIFLTAGSGVLELFALAFAMAFFPNLVDFRFSLGSYQHFAQNYQAAAQRELDKRAQITSDRAIWQWSSFTKILVFLFFIGFTVLMLWAYSDKFDWFFLLPAIVSLLVSALMLRYLVGRRR